MSFATVDEINNDEDAALFGCVAPRPRLSRNPAARRHPLINHVSPENLFSPGVHGPGWEPYGEETKDPDRAAASPWADMLNADGVGPGSSAAWEERRSRLVGSSTPRATPALAPEAGSLEAAWQKARGGAEGS